MGTEVMQVPAELADTVDAADRSGWSFDDYVAAWRQVDDRVLWVRSRLAMEVQDHAEYGDQALQRYAEAVGREYKTLLNWATVAKAYPESSWRREVSFSVYQAFAAQDDRLELIKDWTGTVAEAEQKVSDRARAKRDEKAGAVPGEIVANQETVGSGATSKPASRGKGTARATTKPKTLTPAEERRKRLYGNAILGQDACKLALEHMADAGPLTIDVLAKALETNPNVNHNKDKVVLAIWKDDGWSGMAADVLAELEAAKLAKSTPDGWVTGEKFTLREKLTVCRARDVYVTVYDAAERGRREALAELGFFLQDMKPWNEPNVKPWDREAVSGLVDRVHAMLPDDARTMFTEEWNARK